MPATGGLSFGTISTIMLEKITTPPISKEEAEGQIGVILNNVSIMGFNDYEIPELMKLMDEVRNEKVNPQEALNRANFILEQKQDYH